MKRLTDKRFTKSGFVAISSEERKKLYIPTLEEVYAKLAEYEDAEEAGTLIRLPCKIGDKAYVIEEIFPSKRSLYKRRIKEIDISSINFFLDEIFIHDYDGFDYLIGEVFFTREEAEASLKEDEK